MLFKEKMYLSNCDSVRGLSNDEIRKRFLIGLVFGNGVILSPNILFDTKGLNQVLEQKNVIKFLNEEGYGNFIIRGMNIENINSFSDYFEKLPSNYKISNLNGIEKGELTRSQLQYIGNNIKYIDKIIQNIKPVYQNALIQKDSLSKEIFKRISIDYFDDDEKFNKFLLESEKLVSRSEWYTFLNIFLKGNETKINSIKSEIIDPAYNSLFINNSESFIQDNIKVLDKIPEKILSGMVTINSLKNEIELIEYPLKAFEIVTTIGTTELFKIITDEALSYIEDKATEKGISFFSRKNWFGLYPILKNKLGLEIKC
ncbi:hypothetical protein CRU86_07410 [Aliarcobacter skirrowii]|uniref:Uncharacterized protein n=1 Tax=Aliarcobacter cryaerophilus TaxID=28198 RepID=A0A2S9SKR1_9BACT|nr:MULTISPECIES: hypothetical protein [Aliarcobacter]PRM87166.1 hypothetical protein CJ669_09230 [Aliarcobacter cryaerophilus]QNM90199.1 hypothetical protein HOO34_00170 [Aliarcobacter cryaerophilus]RXJ76261.1 hypothetical protein CRU86_07410 [Aliarcobacter skirrowii]